MTNKKNQVVRLDEVKQAWAVTFSKHADFSKNIVAKRILTMALHKIGIKAQKGDIDIANLATEDLTVNFTVKQYLSATDTGKGTSKSYFGLIKKGIEVLASVTVTMHNKETDKWFVVNVLDTSEKNVTNGHLGNGEYRILFNPVFLAVAGDLKQFSTFDFVGYMQLDSFYNQRLYELLSAWRDTGEWYVSVEDFAKHLGIKKPMRYPNMEQRVIAPAKE